jgi:hypothetical protein
MASYIDVAYLQGKMGSEVYADLVAVTGINVVQMIRDNTDVVRGALRNSGYDDMDVDDGGATLPNQVPRLAVYALVREELMGVPDVNIPLPANWEQGAAKMALESILDGDADLTGWPKNTVNAVGGVLFTESDAGIADSTPQFTSRENMRGF